MKKIIENFKPTGGKHCITTALKQVFNYYDYPITEEMIFGIGSGLSFCYINLDKSPMVSGRTNLLNLKKNLGKDLILKLNANQVVSISLHLIKPLNF
ncbi:A predicted NlpC/p60-like peptidase family protein [[Clostridium] sordellii ATCC 9714]|nr:A predicted NlpC/p60-like peptidase family protein [[Clostridium] sordellii ATCC 9714] [Paeniclostridium sordellii ATCC 9714]